MAENKNDINRRHFLRDSIWGACLAGLGAAPGARRRKSSAQKTLWQKDPEKIFAGGNIWLFRTRTS